MFTDDLRRIFHPLSMKCGSILKRGPFSPNGLTALSLLVGLGAALTVYLGYLVWGAVLFSLSAMLDFLNGSLARATHREAKFGALFDSVADRIVEITIIIVFALYSKELLLPALLSVSSIMLSSYISKHAEAVGTKNGGGLIERNEKFLFIVIALILNNYAEIILYILSVLVLFTAIHRFFKAYKSLEAN